MGKDTIVKLKTNIPHTMRVDKVYWQESRKEGWSDQIALVDQAKGERVYLNDMYADELCGLGVLNFMGEHEWSAFGHTITILREEDGTKKKTTFTLADGAGSEPPTGGSERKPRATVSDRQALAQMQYNMTAAVMMAQKAWIGGYGLPDGLSHEDLLGISAHVEAIQKTAVTLFIEMTRQGIKAPKVGKDE